MSSEFMSARAPQAHKSQSHKSCNTRNKRLGIPEQQKMSQTAQAKDNNSTQDDAKGETKGNFGSSSTKASGAAVFDHIIEPMNSLTMSEQDRRQNVQTENSHLSSNILFTDPSLPLPDAVRRAIVQKLKFVTLSHIQAESIPRILRGENLIAQAQGGSGKTVAFVIGMLAKINVAEPTLQAICLTNSRELANQIYHGAVLPLSQFMTGIRPEVMLKGDDDRRGRRSNAHLIVGTPGTVQSAIRQRPQAYIDASTVKIFVLDEADFMVSEPTIRLQTQEIRKHVPQTAQTLFFSATYTPEVLASSRKWVPNARIIRLKSNEELILEEIMQLWVNTSEVGKLKVLQDLYSTLSIQQSIIFVESKVDADKLTRAMKADKFTVSTLHSGIVGTNGFTTEQMRDEVMRQFRSGESKVLIATNALARGVDVPSVAVVVNYDLPVKRENNIDVPDPETYLHRICRTGRFGRSGTAINFIDNETDYNIMRAIETVFSPGKTMINQWDVHDIEGLAESHNARSEGVDVAAIDPVSASAKSTDSSNDSNGSGNVPPPASNGKADDTLVGK